jgi:hypothetical protein
VVLDVEAAEVLDDLLAIGVQAPVVANAEGAVEIALRVRVGEEVEETAVR